MLSSEELKLALATGFIDESISSNELLQPNLLLNDRENGKKVLSTLINYLESCDEFWLYAAFLTRTGIKCLHNTLRERIQRTLQWHPAQGSSQCRVVHFNQTCSDRHRNLAQTVQSHSSPSSPEYATASD